MHAERRAEMTVTLTAAEAFRASIALAWRNRGWARALVLLLAVFLVGLQLRASDSLQPAAILILAVGILAAIVGLMYLRSRSMLRNTRVYRSPLTYVFTEKGISVRGPTFTAESDWCNVHEVLETRTMLILCPPTSAMTILPKRCFPDPSVLIELRRLVRAHVSGKVKMLS